MQDYRIKRTIIRMGENQKEILYIYNSAEFELIPFNEITDDKNNIIQIGNPFVLMRFMLIDLWMVRLISNLGGIDPAYALQRQQSILKKLIDLRTMISSQESTTLYNDEQITDIADNYFTGTNELRVFQDTCSEAEDIEKHQCNYIGQYQNEVVSMKLLAKQSDRFVDYIPEDYKKRTGQYRVIVDKTIEEAVINR